MASPTSDPIHSPLSDTEEGERSAVETPDEDSRLLSESARVCGSGGRAGGAGEARSCASRRRRYTHTTWHLQYLVPFIPLDSPLSDTEEGERSAVETPDEDSRLLSESARRVRQRGARGGRGRGAQLRQPPPQVPLLAG
ncbi:unnamed protein product [Plutella xylostella]|uniref:(diamondback moth) hypothetical protein n=1 Tax=Plutella xylostella TaxID=51655 RepID=A0A8S4G145_PLUXY|nr:unnamed protein product [Plutella xylostella]